MVFYSPNMHELVPTHLLKLLYCKVVWNSASILFYMNDTFGLVGWNIEGKKLYIADEWRLGQTRSKTLLSVLGTALKGEYLRDSRVLIHQVLAFKGLNYEDVWNQVKFVNSPKCNTHYHLHISVCFSSQFYLLKAKEHHLGVKVKSGLVTEQSPCLPEPLSSCVVER